MSKRGEHPNLYSERIIRDPKICGGQPVFKGTRVILRTVLAALAEGDSAEEILAEYPTLKPEDIRSPLLRLPLRKICPCLKFPAFDEAEA
jgi:uncharacterized protein (DUF433 family)